MSNSSLLTAISNLNDTQLTSIVNIHDYAYELEKKIYANDLDLSKTVDLCASMCFDNHMYEVSIAIEMLESDIFNLALKDYYKLHYPSINTESAEFNNALMKVKRHYKHRTAFRKLRSQTQSMRLCQMIMSNTVNLNFDSYDRVDVNDCLMFGFDSHDLSYAPAAMKSLVDNSKSEQLWFQLLLNSSRVQKLIQDEAKSTLSSIVGRFKFLIQVSSEIVKNEITTIIDAHDIRLYDLLYNFSQGNSSYSYLMLSSAIPMFKFTNYNEAMHMIEWFDALTPLTVDRLELSNFWITREQEWLNVPDMLERIQSTMIEVMRNKRPKSNVPIEDLKL